MDEYLEILNTFVQFHSGKYNNHRKNKKSLSLDEAIKRAKTIIERQNLSMEDRISKL